METRWSETDMKRWGDLIDSQADADEKRRQLEALFLQAMEWGHQYWASFGLRGYDKGQVAEQFADKAQAITDAALTSAYAEGRKDEREDFAGTKLWLWKNHVDGRPEFWAFEHLYPIHMDNGDPQTLGEPCGYALFKPSRNGRQQPSASGAFPSDAPTVNPASEAPRPNEQGDA